MATPTLFHPDNLKPQRDYHVTYMAIDGSIREEVGKFCEMDTRGNVLRLWFSMDSGLSIPFYIYELINVKERQ